jgi:hypothetical protein
MSLGGRVTAYAAACLVVAAALQGCSNFKKDIGLEPTMPDEFAVQSRAPLSLPPDYDLRPPKPGTPRPQEKTAAQQARNAFEQAGPGQPGSQATANLNELGAPPGGGADPNAQIAPDSLAGKLLGYDGQGDVAVTKRTTSPLKDVY